MTSLTAWQRCEPHSRSSDLGISLEMRISDPLWMLGRQWQFGEFKGEDAGSPVWVSWTGSQMPLDLYLPGSVSGHLALDVQPYDAERPLESIVGRESLGARDAMLLNRRLAVEAGEHFVRLLPNAMHRAYRAGLLSAVKVERLVGAQRGQIDPASLAYLDLVAGRALDGVRLLGIATTAAPESAAATLGFASVDIATAAAAIRSWLDWVASTIGPFRDPLPARKSWDPSRLEYAFAVAAPASGTGDQYVLEAAQYNGGPLDWYSVDLHAGKLLKEATKTPTPVTGAALPTGLQFRGMPSRRLWEFEDARVNFGATSAAATDLTKLLFLEFLLQSGDDFFVVPIELPYGSLCRIETVRITNTFGDDTIAAPFSNDDWRMFSLSSTTTLGGSAPQSLLFLPPVVGQETVSEPLERVQLMRDEMANICWAIERVVESRTGRPIDLQQAWQTARVATLPPPGDSQHKFSWQLDTWADSSPDYWLPLTPTVEEPGVLKLLGTAKPPRSRVIAEIADLEQGKVYDEEIPRAGALIERRWQYCRWHDGATHAWIARRSRIGKGEGSSGLAYDVLR